MKTPERWIELDEVGSTQDYALELLAKDPSSSAVVIAKNQTAGKGRFNREWFSEPGSSLTMSLVLGDYAGFKSPHLLGMAVAVASAAAIHSRVSWPNDLMRSGRKLGGILTQLAPDGGSGQVPIVGVGINLNVSQFPAELQETATSLLLEFGHRFEPRTVAEQIIERIRLMPEPETWAQLEPIWSLFDSTPGKRYRLIEGEEAIAIGVGPEGSLICAVDGETRNVLAADSLLGAG